MYKLHLAIRTTDTAHMFPSFSRPGIDHTSHSSSKFYMGWFIKLRRCTRRDPWETSMLQQLPTSEYHIGTGLLCRRLERVSFLPVWEDPIQLVLVDQMGFRQLRILSLAISSNHWILLSYQMHQWVLRLMSQNANNIQIGGVKTEWAFTRHSPI
jgi:hypothetical protein